MLQVLSLLKMLSALTSLKLRRFHYIIDHMLFHKSHIFNIDGRSYRLRNFNVDIQSPKMEGS